MDILENAKPENCFYCIDGSVLRNILELEQKLRTISNRVFYHHASQSRNDFRNWVRDVFHEHNLANELLKAKTPAEAAAAVRRHIRKTFLAEEEIESAIRKVVEARKPAEANVKEKAKAKVKTVAVAVKKLPNRKTITKKTAKVVVSAKTTTAKETKQQMQKSKRERKNRKLNKKQRKKTGSRSDYGKRGKSARRSRTNGGSMFQKNVKKQARQWLKWLNINPEL